jgi:CheY-like chemotaxis protein
MMKNNKQLAKLLMRLHGVDVSRYEKSFLDKTLRQRLDENHYDSLEEYCVCLEQDDQEAEKLLDSLKISYSDFFRNPLTFAVLEQIILPGMDGIEAFKAIRQLPDLQHIPVIAITASAMVNDRETILAHGFDAYISKPVDEHIFFKIINETLYGK